MPDFSRVHAFPRPSVFNFNAAMFLITSLSLFFQYFVSALLFANPRSILLLTLNVLWLKNVYFFIQSTDFVSILHTSHTIFSFIKTSTHSVDDPYAEEHLFVKDEVGDRKHEKSSKGGGESLLDGQKCGVTQ